MIPLDNLVAETNITVGPATPLLDALEQMARIDATSALVVDNRRPAGILTHQDVVHLIAGRQDWGQLVVGDVMSKPVVTVEGDMSCHSAYHLMLEKGIRHLVLNSADSANFRVIGEKAFLNKGNLRDDTVAPQVGAIMHRSPPQLPPDASVHDVVALMSRDNSDYIVIAHHDRPLGIITERDIFRHRALLIDSQLTPADQIMHTPVLTTEANTPVYSALEQMETFGVRRLIVVGLDSRIKGAVSLHQLIGERQRRYLNVLHANLQECEELRFPGQLLDVISDGVLIIERDTTLIVDANPRLAGWLGYAADHINGMSLTRLLEDPMSLPQWGTSRDLLPIGPIFKTHLRALDRTAVPVEVSTKRVTFEERNLVVAIIRDLTAKEAANQALRASEARLRQIFETNQAVKLVIDPQDGRIVDANQAASSFYGYPHDELVGLNIDRINMIDGAALNSAMTQASQQQRLSFQFRHRLASGELRDVEVYSGPLQSDGHTLLYSIIHDITDRVRAEAALRSSEERLDMALRGADLGLWDWNVQTGEVAFSERWASMLGLSRADLQPHVDSWTRLLHPDDVPEVTEILQQHLDGHTKLYESTFRLRHADGGWRWILARGQVVEWDEHGKPLRAAGTQMDVTASRTAHERLRLLATVFENSNEGVLITDASTRIIEVNNAFTEITGYAAEEVIGKTPKVFSSGRHDAAFYQGMWRQLEEVGFWRGEIWNRRKQGEVYPEWLSISQVSDGNGKPQHYVAVFADLSEQHRTEQELDFLAHHDALTNLPNRLLFNARLEHALGHAVRAKNQLALLFVDLDRFKTINDSLGHALGDTVLQQVSALMHQAMRADDTMARLGGDEFIILLENTTPAGIREVAEKLSSTLDHPLLIGSEKIYVSLSAGISIYPRDGSDAGTLIKNAEAAMYKAKSSGRDNFQFYTPDLTDEALEQVFLQNHLRRAIENDEFRVFYQPQVDIESGQAVGVEALLRWQHPTEGLIMPLRFIPLLEEQGMMRQVGPWVLRRACEDYVSWQEQGIAPKTVGVNLSGAQIHSAEAVDGVARILQDTHMPAEHLELEVTETFVMSDPESNINTLHRLRALGIRLAIDDFGTGYSSLAYLKRLPINKLKIDRSFVKDVPGDADDEAITRAVVGLGKSLNLDIIAEGVDRKACVDFLLNEGCYFGQGYLWAKPMPEDEVRLWLTDHSAN